MEAFIGSYLIAVFNLFLFLIFSLARKRKREREKERESETQCLPFLLQHPDGYSCERERDRQDEMETGTEKVFHSQMKPNEERQLLYRLTTQTQ